MKEMRNQRYLSSFTNDVGEGEIKELLLGLRRDVQAGPGEAVKWDGLERECRLEREYQEEYSYHSSPKLGVAYTHENEQTEQSLNSFLSKKGR